MPVINDEQDKTLAYINIYLHKDEGHISKINPAVSYATEQG